MKLLIICILTLSYAHAGIIKFVGPCSERPVFETNFSPLEDDTVGSVTVEVLASNDIPFLGTERSMNSIFNTPTGLDAMEVLSDTQMNAHGWCYSINGKEPNLFANEIKAQQNDEILWWFGYAHYDSGKWITQCEPTYTRAPEQFCAQ